MDYIVYIKADEMGRVTDINSSAFVADASGWIGIDKGDGDRYHHAQGNYLPKPLYDEYGRHNFRYEDGCIIEISDEEKPDLPAPVTAPPSNAELAAAIAELAEEMFGG